MPRLGETTSILSELKRQDTGKSSTAERMSLRSDRGANLGQLKMFSYVPAELQPNAPLVVLLHGCGQSAVDYASGAGWLDLADRLGFAVLAPQQITANNSNRCFNWFCPDDTHRGGGEAASIAEAIVLMVAAEGLDAGRVFVTGLSAGGAMALAMLASYPDVFAGGAVVAGLPFGVANDMMQALAAMHQVSSRSAAELGELIPTTRNRSFPRLTIWHGDADHVVSPNNAVAIAKQWAIAQGLSEKPDRVLPEARRTKSVWLKRGGEVAIELNLLKGLGHGVPLSTTGAMGVGKAAPFMLEAGVSSSQEIAEFWGIAATIPSDDRARTPVGLPLPMELNKDVGRLQVSERDAKTRQTSESILGGQVLASVVDRVPAGVHDVIAKALRTAGLMR